MVEPTSEPEREPEIVPEPEAERSTYAPEAETPAPESAGGAPMIIRTVIYCVYIVLIVAGNTMVIAIMIRKKAISKKVVHMYVVSLAVADLMIGCLVVPSGLFDLYYKGDMGYMICRICHYFLNTARNSTIMGLTILTIDRFLRFMNIYEMSHKQAAIVIFVKWMCAALYAIRAPIFYDIVIKKIGSQISKICNIVAEYTIINTYFIFIDTFLLFIIPWTILTVSYALIIRKLRKEMKTAGERDPQKEKIIKMLVVAVICCFIGLAPNHFLRFYLHYSKNWFKGSMELMVAFSIIGFTNSWFRVVLYIIFNDVINGALRELFGVLKEKKKKNDMKTKIVPLW